MTIMGIDDAIKIVEKEAQSKKYDPDSLPLLLKHSYETGVIARGLAEKFGLNPEEITLAGVFHDIGRCFSADREGHTFHEIIGARYIEEKGVELRVSDSQEQCDRIAQSFRSHFVVYEQFGMPEYAKWLPGLRDTNPNLLLPKSWNEVIIVYADLTNKIGERISFEERMADIKERDRNSNNQRLIAIEKAEFRLFGIKKDLESALERCEIDTAKYDIL